MEETDNKNAVTIHIDSDAFLEDTQVWINRFDIKSETSNSTYRIAQSRANRSWSCECLGFRRHRNCKHLKAVGLLGGGVPFEPKIFRD